MKQNNYQRLTAVYTGIALVSLIAVLCVLRGQPDPLYLLGGKLPHWFFAGFSVLSVLYFPVVLLRLKKSANADKNYQMIFRVMPVILLLMLIILWTVLLSAKPEPQQSVGSADAYWILALLGSIALILISNNLPRLRQNGVLGIQDPWTKKNAVCWTRTHRFAGRLCVCTGALCAAALLILKRISYPDFLTEASACILLAELICMLIPPHVYAYRHRNDAE